MFIRFVVYKVAKSESFDRFINVLEGWDEKQHLLNFV